MRRVTTTALFAVGLAVSVAAWADDSANRSDQGTAEDILQTPAGQLPNAPAGDMGSRNDQDVVGPSDEQRTQEAVVPVQSATVSGKIKMIDKKSGYFTLRTDDGKDLRLHADPTLLKEQNVKKGAEVTASYEMRGKMKHVTIIQEGGPVRSPAPEPTEKPGAPMRNPGQAPSGSQGTGEGG